MCTMEMLWSVDCAALRSPYVLTGAHISEKSTRHYLPDLACLGQRSCQNTMKEWSEL